MTRDSNRRRPGAPPVAFVPIVILLLGFARWARTDEGSFPVSGTVLSDAGRPLAGVTVSLDESAATTETAGRGTYRILVPPGSHVLSFRRTGYRADTLSLTVSGPVTGLETRLAPVYRLSESVVVQAIRADVRTPVTKQDISREEIERLDYGQEMPFLLKNAPSITQYADTGTGSGYAYLYLRGIPQTRLNMTLDGVPLSDSEDSALYFVDFGNFAASLDSIQIQRGVGTSTVGTASYGGSINFASVDPGRDREASADLGSGSFGTNRASLAARTGRFGPGLAFYARGSYQETDGFRDHSGVVQRSLFAGGSRQGDRSFLKVFGFTGREKTQLAFLAPEKDVLERDLRANPLSPAERDRFGQDFLHAQYTRALRTSSSVSVQGYYNGAGGWYRLFDDPSQATLRQYELDWRYLGGLVTFRHSRGPLSLDAGAHANDFRSTHGRVVVEGPRDYTNHGHKNEANAFAKLGYDLGPWHLYGDAQLRWARFRYEGDVPLGSVDWTFFNPKVGVRYDVGPRLGVYASVGRATREPARSDMLAGEDNATIAYDLRGVEPERVVDVEAGLEYRSGGWSASANLYAMEFRNEIALTGELSQIGLPLRRNVDRSHRRGIELSAAWLVAPRLRLTGNANLSRNRIATWTQFYDVFDEAGAFLESVSREHHDVSPLLTPAVVANLGADYSPVPFLNVAAAGRYVAKAYLDNTQDAALTTPSFFNLDATLLFDLGRFVKAGHPRIRIQVNNVFDNRRIFPSGYSYLYFTRDPAGRDTLAGIPYYYPLATRSVFVGLDLKL
jgi:iron complex outermembrane recepter protein